RRPGPASGGVRPRSSASDHFLQQGLLVTFDPQIATTAAALGVIDVRQFGVGPVEVLIDQHIVEVVAVLDLALGVGDAALDHVLGVLRARHQTATKLLKAGRQDEDPYGVAGAFGGHVAGALPVDV